MNSKALKIELKDITKETLSEYLKLSEVIKTLEKKKDELRSSILYAYPSGGTVENYMIFIDQQDRRSFPLDEVKAKVDEDQWTKVYAPFIKISTSTKLTVKKI